MCKGQFELPYARQGYWSPQRNTSRHPEDSAVYNSSFLDCKAFVSNCLGGAAHTISARCEEGYTGTAWYSLPPSEHQRASFALICLAWIGLAWLCFARLTVKGCRCSARCEVGFYKFFGKCYACDRDSWSYAWSIILVLMIVSAWWLINNVVCALIDSLAVRAALGASLRAAFA